MKPRNASRSWALAPLFLLSALSLVAAEQDPAARVKLEDPQSLNKNRFSVSYRAGFNISAQYKNVANVGHGPSDSRGPGPATGSGIDRFYDDGYNRVDIRGSKDGITWFWGYKNPSQIVGDQVIMHSSTASAINSKPVDADVSHGFEVTYNREFTRGKKNDWMFGLEGAFGWMNVCVNDERQLSGGVRTIADAYNLGIIPSPAPYSGNYEGPNSLIEDSPSRTITSNPNGSLVTGSRNFESDLFTFRLGPYLDLPVHTNWTVSLSAGLAVGVMDGTFRFNENTSAGGSSTHQIGAGSNADVLWGGYASANIRYTINRSWSVFVGGQYMGLSDYTAQASRQKVVLDLSAAAFCTGGISYSF